MAEKMGTASKLVRENGDCLRFRRLSAALSETVPRNRLAVPIFECVFSRSGQ